tara:strand:- start:36211 stop:36435 length:225 start_codon:yes stop_codon:yes gene_type:complete
MIIIAPNHILESTTSLKIKYPASDAHIRPVYSNDVRRDASAFCNARLKKINANPPVKPVRKNRKKSNGIGVIQL